MDDSSPDNDHLRRAARALVTTSRALVGVSLRSLAAAPVEVTLAQHRVLVLLASRGSHTVGQVAREIGVDQSNASRILDRLERLDLVERSRSRTDGREVAASLLPRGREVVDAVSKAREQELATLLTELTTSERRAVTRGLTAFNRVAGELDETAWVPADRR